MTTRSSTPTRVTRRLVAWTRVLRLSVVRTSPRWALPEASLGKTCQTASQAPRSDQPASRCCIPCDYVPVRSWPLFRARELMHQLIESFVPLGKEQVSAP